MSAPEAREAARIAQVGYTAVIDRMTPALDLGIVAANVARSVGSAGGAPADLPALTEAWAPVEQRGAVVLFDQRFAEGPFGTQGVLAFGITVEAQGHRGAIAATAVLHEPSQRLRDDAAVLSAALAEVLAAIVAGAAPAPIAARFAGGTAAISGSAELVLLVLDGSSARSVLDGPAFVDGDVVAVSAIARTAEGPVVFQTTVRVSASGAERLDAIPLRLIELR